MGGDRGKRESHGEVTEREQETAGRVIGREPEVREADDNQVEEERGRRGHMIQEGSKDLGNRTAGTGSTSDDMRRNLRPRDVHQD